MQIVNTAKELVNKTDTIRQDLQNMQFSDNSYSNAMLYYGLKDKMNAIKHWLNTVSF